MSTPMTRRAFLVAGGSALALAACSSSGKSTESTPSSASIPPWNLVELSSTDSLAAGAPVRFPFGLADAEGATPSTLPVTALTFTVTDASGAAVRAPVTVAARSENLPRPYFPVVFTPPKAGVYTFSSNVAGTPVSHALQIGDGGTVPQVGEPMIPYDTPTTTDLRGVQLLCTNTPQCPLHDVTLTAALAEARPVAFLIATPKYCQVAVCGPVLDNTLALLAEFPQVRFLHSEVYPSDAAAQPTVAEVVPVVTAYGLTYEPVMFVAGADGKVSTRLDSIFDTSELREALRAVTG
jgi:hypothetical protein